MLIYKKFILLLAFITALAFFSGCQYVGLSLDELLKPPMLTEEQGEIFAALTAGQTGNKIKLLYPESGDNRSAFTIANIAGGDGEQAIVFYESISTAAKTEKTDTSTVRITVLDQEDGKWVEKYSDFGEGTFVDKIILVKNNNSGRVFIIVGYGSLNLEEKVFHVYTYQNGKLHNVYDNGSDREETYTKIEAFDIDDNGNEEIIYIGKKYESQEISDEESSTNVARMLRFNGDNLEYVNEVALNKSVSSYISMKKGKIGDGTPGIYLDGRSVYGSQVVYNTQILGISNDRLYNFTGNSKLLSETERMRVENCMDVDGDGILEIPVTTPFPGYDETDEADKFYMTNWIQYDKLNYELKLQSYVNTKYKYIFKFPPEWAGKVTAKSYVNRTEICFFLYNNRNMEDETYELLRIRTVLSGEKKAVEDEGFVRIGPESHIVFMYKLPKNDVPNYAVTDSYVINNFFTFINI